MKPLASFIIPVRNGGAFIAQTLHSCLSQNASRFEIIVVNDGSTDRTSRILEYFKPKDKRLRVIDLPENKGRSYARNLGGSEAKSDVLMVLDADDISLPNRVGDTLEYLKKNPTIDVTYGGYQKIDPLGIVLQSELPKPFDPEASNLRKEMHICHSTMAFRKSVFEKVQYSNGEYSSLGIDDWKFQLDAHRAGFRFSPVPKILSQYRLEFKERDEKRVMELKVKALNESNVHTN